MNNTNNSLRFDKGVMRLSAFDPQSNQYETRILKLPELPLLESLENMFDNSGRKILRMTKSCNSKKSENGSSTSLNSIGSQPRRCQSQPNLSKQQQQQQQRKKTLLVPSIRSKKTLSSAFQAVAGLFQKGTNNSTNQKMSLQQRQNLTCDNWWMSSPPISSC